MSKSQEWLGSYSHPLATVDRATWCLIRSGDHLLTRRVADLRGRDLMETTTWSPFGGGRSTATNRVGRYVRHADVAAVLDRGSDRKVSEAVSRLGGVVCGRDIAAIALTGSARVTALIAAHRPNLEWSAGVEDAVGTGCDETLMGRRARRVAKAVRLARREHRDVAPADLGVRWKPVRTLAQVEEEIERDNLAGLLSMTRSELANIDNVDIDALRVLAALSATA